ncbi:transcriptional regulator [Caballeronia glathei]|jgi:DNA-binding MurR/RpiR family transcriptional regulator|nr:transcriptional regulator [Caballeronia glathei]
MKAKQRGIAARPMPASARRSAVASAVQPDTRSGILTRIEGLRPTLGPASQRIADFIAQYSQDVIHMSVSDVAERTASSEGSVIAFCKSVGATGFQQLKILLAQELVQPVQIIHEDLEPDDAVETVVRKLFHSNIQTLHDTAATLDIKSVERAVSLLKAAERIEIYGIGSAAPIAEDAEYRMLRIGLNAKAVVDSHVQAISASLAGPKVATLTVSHSGSTHETVDATRLARESGASTICITNVGKSPLRAYADVVLCTMARETRFRTEAMTSRLAQLAIVDVLVASLALTEYEKSVASLRHTFDVLSIKRY